VSQGVVLTLMASHDWPKPLEMPTILISCTPDCQPVARKTVAVRRIPIMNDFVSMEFIQDQTYER